MMQISHTLGEYEGITMQTARILGTIRVISIISPFANQLTRWIRRRTYNVILQ
jgi:hypothetical protein